MVFKVCTVQLSTAIIDNTKVSKERACKYRMVDSNGNKSVYILSMKTQYLYKISLRYISCGTVLNIWRLFQQFCSRGVDNNKGMCEYKDKFMWKIGRDFFGQ